MATIKASENEFPKVLFTEGAAAATPGTGLVVAYAKSDGLLYFKDDTGTEYPISQAADLAAHLADTGDAHDASAISVLDTAAVFTATDVEAALKELYDSIVASGSVATDVIWDAAGDLVVGTGANTAAKLSLGAAGGAVSRVNGAVAWNSGTSFPTAATGDRYWRTDLGMEFYYDGTRWLSTQVFTQRMIMRWSSSGSTQTGDLSATIAATTAATTRSNAPSVLGCSDIWLVDVRCSFTVASGGTALGASHKWVGALGCVDSAGTSTTVATINVDSGSSGVFRVTTVAIGAVQTSGTIFYQGSWTKTGTPGTMSSTETFSYRIIAT